MKRLACSLVALAGTYWSGVLLGYRWGWRDAASQANRLIALARKGAA